MKRTAQRPFITLLATTLAAGALAGACRGDREQPEPEAAADDTPGAARETEPNDTADAAEVVGINTPLAGVVAPGDVDLWRPDPRDGPVTWTLTALGTIRVAAVHPNGMRLSLADLGPGDVYTAGHGPALDDWLYELRGQGDWEISTRSAGHPCGFSPGTLGDGPATLAQATLPLRLPLCVGGTHRPVRVELPDTRPSGVDAIRVDWASGAPSAGLLRVAAGGTTRLERDLAAGWRPVDALRWLDDGRTSILVDTSAATPGSAELVITAVNTAAEGIADVEPNDTFATANRTSTGTVTGRVDHVSDIDLWTVDAAAPVVSVAVRHAPGARLVLTDLERPTAPVVSEDGTARLCLVAVPADGPATVSVRAEHLPADHDGAYSLEVTAVAGENYELEPNDDLTLPGEDDGLPTGIVVGTRAGLPWVQGHFFPTGDRDRFAFVIAGGAWDPPVSIRFEATPGDLDDIMLSIRDADRVELARAERSLPGEPEVIELELPPGVYELVLATRGTAACSAAWRLAWNVTGRADAGRAHPADNTNAPGSSPGGEPVRIEVDGSRLLPRLDIASDEPPAGGSLGVPGSDSARDDGAPGRALPGADGYTDR